ncbi:MAG: DJ-1/PfpI family protein [Thermomicrobiales bacterium]
MMAKRAYKRRTVGILVFDDVEVLDFCGPLEVFASARKPGREDRDQRDLFDVCVIAQDDRAIRCHGNLLLHPHFTIANHPPLDILLIPGGQGTRRERENQVVLDWIARQNPSTEVTTSVCTGAFLLAALGLLDGLRATTHWASIDWMREQHPGVEMRENVRFVDEGRIVTSAGVSAGIDMALHLIERLHGHDIAVDTARGMEYDWQKQSAADT